MVIPGPLNRAWLTSVVVVLPAGLQERGPDRCTQLPCPGYEAWDVIPGYASVLGPLDGLVQVLHGLCPRYLGVTGLGA